MTYIEIKKNDFYKIGTTTDEKSFMTARGWDNSSEMIYLYEKNYIAVDEALMGQYLRNKKTAKEFAVYYDLFQKSKGDYQIDKILGGKAADDIKERATSGTDYRCDKKVVCAETSLKKEVETVKNCAYR